MDPVLRVGGVGGWQAEEPTIFHAFAGAGVPIAAAAAHWLTQCFWGVLPWPEARRVVTLALTQGADYAVYVCVRVLVHLRDGILAHASSLRLGTWLLAAAAGDFTVAEHLTALRRLEKQYRGVAQPSLEADFRLRTAM